MIVLMVTPETEVVNVTEPPKCAIHPRSRAVGCVETTEGAAINVCLGCFIKWGTHALMVYQSPAAPVTVVREADAETLFGGPTHGVQPRRDGSGA